MKKGFTLPEILVAILIVTVLVVMAVPQYEKAVEKSRKAEVLSTLKKLHESKMRMMDTADITVYDDSFGFQNLDFSLPCKNFSTSKQYKCEMKDFTYCLRLSTVNDKNKNSVCARRNAGDYANTDFIYYGEKESNPDLRFTCYGWGCSVYGMSQSVSVSCACS